MLWTPTKKFQAEPFELEDELEQAVISLATPLFGESRIYLDVKKKIGGKGKQKNIPDGYRCSPRTTRRLSGNIYR